MGVGKTAVCRELNALLPRSVWLDGDWCWQMNPFVVTDETKRMVEGNIVSTLRSFIRCSEFQNIIFCWVMHEEAIANAILSRLDLSGVRLLRLALVCSPEALTERLGADIAAGVRKPDALARSLERLPLYGRLPIPKLDVSSLSPAEAAAEIALKAADIS